MFSTIYYLSLARHCKIFGKDKCSGPSSQFLTKQNEIIIVYYKITTHGLWLITQSCTDSNQILKIKIAPSLLMSQDQALKMYGPCACWNLLIESSLTLKYNTWWKTVLSPKGIVYILTSQSFPLPYLTFFWCWTLLNFTVPISSFQIKGAQNGPIVT